MASKSICSRCLRLALPAKPSTVNSVVARLAFSSSATKQHSNARKLHQSTKQRATSAVDASRQNTQDIPPYNVERNGQNGEQSRVLLQPNNLFHSYTNSPSPQIRKRAAFMKQNAYCPHPEHQATRMPTSPLDLEARKTGSMPPAHVRYECPDCGIPVSCSEQHFVSDYENHLEICDILREINEDDHDLVSGRFFPEFEYPGPQMEEAQVNMTNWDTLMYSREFTAINDERSMRQATRLLTYPITIGSVLHELSPYGLKDKLTPEGLRSLTGRSFSKKMQFACISNINSPSLYPSPTTIRRRYRHQRPPTQRATRPSLHPWSPRRIKSTSRSLDPTHIPLPPGNLPPNLHRPRIHAKPRRRIPPPRTNTRQPLRSHRRGQRPRRPSEDLHIRRILSHPPSGSALLSLRSLL